MRCPLVGLHIPLPLAILFLCAHRNVNAQVVLVFLVLICFLSDWGVLSHFSTDLFKCDDVCQAVSKWILCVYLWWLCFKWGGDLLACSLCTQRLVCFHAIYGEGWGTWRTVSVWPSRRALEVQLALINTPVHPHSGVIYRPHCNPLHQHSSPSLWALFRPCISLAFFFSRSLILESRAFDFLVKGPGFDFPQRP